MGRRIKYLVSERPESVNSNASSRKSANLNKSKGSFGGSYSSISGSLKNFEETDRNAHNVSETILENDVFENLSPRFGSKLPARPLSPSSLPTSPLSLPTSPAKPKPSLTNPTSPLENPKPHLSRKSSFRSSMPIGKPPLPSQLPK